MIRNPKVIDDAQAVLDARLVDATWRLRPADGQDGTEAVPLSEPLPAPCAGVFVLEFIAGNGGLICSWDVPSMVHGDVVMPVTLRLTPA